jgi:hypothetical protein
VSKKSLTAKCFLCNKKYTNSGMSSHLKKCLPLHLAQERLQEGESLEKFYHLCVSGSYKPYYCLHLKAFTGSPLKKLDTFLRKIWLECCGHRSSFLRAGRREVGMKTLIEKCLMPKMELSYEYDFGSTTELDIRSLGEYQGLLKKGNEIELLSRNSIPEMQCTECGKEIALELCTECLYKGRGILCKNCLKTHSCDPDLRLPVVNSPRMGVCAYTGE